MSEKKKRRRRWPWIVAVSLLLPIVAIWLLGLWISPPNGGKALAEAAGFPFPGIIAHRGDSHNAPEGTRPAHIVARTMGAHYLECDAQLTRDGRLVVFHDDDLLRTTDVSRKFPDRSSARIGSFDLDELKRLDAGQWFNGEYPDRARSTYAGLRILTLDELIDIAEQGENKPGLYIETKPQKHNPGVEKAIVSALTRRGWISDGNPVVTRPREGSTSVQVGLRKARVIFQSFSEESLKRLAEEAPGVPRVLLVLDKTVRQDGWSAVLGRARPLAVGIGPSGWNAFWWRTGPAHDAGLVVHPYTINSRPEMLLLRQFGADGFFTDRPGLGLVVTGQAESIDVDALLRSHGF